MSDINKKTDFKHENVHSNNKLLKFNFVTVRSKINLILLVNASNVSISLMVENSISEIVENLFSQCNHQYAFHVILYNYF